jgi:hypothetical protein
MLLLRQTESFQSIIYRRMSASNEDRDLSRRQPFDVVFLREERFVSE